MQKLVTPLQNSFIQSINAFNSLDNFEQITIALDKLEEAKIDYCKLLQSIPDNDKLLAEMDIEYDIISHITAQGYTVIRTISIDQVSKLEEFVKSSIYPLNNDQTINIFN